MSNQLFSKNIHGQIQYYSTRQQDIMYTSSMFKNQKTFKYICGKDKDNNPIYYFFNLLYTGIIDYSKIYYLDSSQHEFRLSKLRKTDNNYLQYIYFDSKKQQENKKYNIFKLKSKRDIHIDKEDAFKFGHKKTGIFFIEEDLNNFFKEINRDDNINLEYNLNLDDIIEKIKLYNIEIFKEKFVDVKFKLIKCGGFNDQLNKIEESLCRYITK